MMRVIIFSSICITFLIGCLNLDEDKDLYSADKNAVRTLISVNGINATVEDVGFSNNVNVLFSDIRIDELRLSNYGIETLIIPPEVTRQLDKVFFINLRYNRLKTIPNDIMNFVSLESIDITNNDICLSDVSGSSWIEIAGDWVLAQYCSTTVEYKNDSNAVQAVFDINFIDTIDVRSVSYMYDNRIRTLDFFDMGITVMPPEIGFLSALTGLSFEKNLLQTITPDIGGLSGLVELNLSRNDISSIPEEISELKSLKRLNLSYNNIDIFPNATCQLLQLEELDLSGNAIVELSPEIGNLTNLTLLDLRHNRLTTLPYEITNLTNFDTTSQIPGVKLAGNNIDTLPPEIEVWAIKYAGY